MSRLILRLKTANSTITITDRIASFVLEKEAYTPYSQLSVTLYGTFQLAELGSVYRAQFFVDDTELHNGTIETLETVRKNGTSYLRLSSRGLTAMLLQNQLEPGLHPQMSLDKLMTQFYTFPAEITWEKDADTSNYLYVKENTSMWDGVANLTYKLYERYPFVCGANEVRMHLPTTYRTFYTQDTSLLSMGITVNQSRIYSDFYMADADGTYGAFHETDAKATARGIVRTKQLALDRQYLYDPQQALAFRRKFAERGLNGVFVEMNGALVVSLGDRLSDGTLLDQAPINRIRMVGDRRGVRTRLEAYQDAFYPTVS